MSGPAATFDQAATPSSGGDLLPNPSPPAPANHSRHPAARDADQARALHLLEALQQALAIAPPHEPPPGWLGRLRTRFAAPAPPIAGAYLWGGVGRGKTFVMDRFYAGLPLAEKRREHFHQFMAGIHDALHQLPPQPDPLRIIADQIAQDTRVLCLDEFIVTDIGDAMMLHGLLHALFERGVTLVTTSNTAPDDLYRNGLQRQRFLPAIDLIKQHTQVLHLDAGNDYRMQSDSEAHSFLTPSGPAADAHLERRFHRWADGPTQPQNSLRVNRRDIPLRQLSSGAVWFDFSALCDSPRSSLDYLAIARDFHTVLISDVPVLNAARDSSARRFLHLVDVFYDQNIRLFLSAEKPLEQLFQGHLPTVSYERLRSRLTEMLSRFNADRPHQES